MPGHDGVTGYEYADALTKRAVIAQGRAMDHVDTFAALRDACRIEKLHIGSIINRLIELGVKRGIARREEFAGSMRRVVNQHRTGVISRHTLKILLGRRSEHLWVCPECNDDSTPQTN